MSNKNYTELSKLKTRKERFEYLKTAGTVGQSTFGFNRYLNQAFYHSKEWREARRKVILRDSGCDLGIEGYEIFKNAHVHHMNEITEKDILERNPDIFNPEYLITVSEKTHKALTYGGDISENEFTERKPNDTIPWKRS